MSSLTRIVPWSHQLVCEVLCPGDLAVDLTTGKGRDTLALYKSVGVEGQVVSFDVQNVALQQATAYLAENGVTVARWDGAHPLSQSPGVCLVNACHSRLAEIVHAPVQAIIANLGYLPGGDQNLITSPDSTLAALRQSLDLLSPGGRLAVTVYSNHPGGSDEANAVDAFFSGLSREKWQVLLLRAANRDEAPYLLVAEHIC